MSGHKITIEIDTDRLAGYTPTQLATAWHVAQANPGSQFDDGEAGQIVERIGREIIKRWLMKAGPELYHHQGHHYYWRELTKLGKWKDGVFVPDVAASNEEEHSDCGRADCDGGCQERAAAQFDRGQM